MLMNEEQMREGEQRIPELGRMAVARAVAKARAAGFSITVREGDNLVEVLPNGGRKLVKKLPPKVTVERGSRLEIR